MPVMVPPGADAGDQDIDLAIGVAPDFLGGCLAVDFWIGRIVELLQQQVARIGGR